MENSKGINADGHTGNGKTEGRIQSDCVMWLWNEYPETRGFLCYNLGNSKNEIDGARNKAMGLMPGRSDLTFYWNRTAYFLECKDGLGVQSPKQKDWQKKVEAAGYEYFLFRTFREFQAIILHIMNTGSQP